MSTVLKTKQFASDNYSGICPEALEMMIQANHYHDSAYGEDEWTKQARAQIQNIFDHKECEIFFVFNGTAANSLALSSLCQPYQSVLCSDMAHIETDECGAPEFFSHGAKIFTLPHHNGKITAQQIKERFSQIEGVHTPKPKAVSIAQSTELGTIYTIEELKAIGDQCKALDLSFHMDGARFSNAVAQLNCHPAEISWKIGVDVLCFGGTKNGMAIGEVIIFFNKALAKDFAYRCKQSGQLCSKMRFLSAPWLGVLSNDAWIKHAQNANRCAQHLSALITQIPGIKLTYPTEANAVFIEMPVKLQHALREKGWKFYTFIGDHIIRLMCSWDMDFETVQLFIDDIKQITSSKEI